MTESFPPNNHPHQKGSLVRPVLAWFKRWERRLQRNTLSHRSIREVLAWWYTGILAVTLCLFGIALYTSVATSLQSDLDKTLALQADGVADAVYAFWKAERVAGPGNWLDAPSSTLRGEVESGRFLDLVTRWAQKTGQLDGSEPIQLLDREGNPMGASNSFLQLQIPLTQTAQTQALQERRTWYESVRVPHAHLRIITKPILEDQTVLYGVRVAASLEPIDASLGRLRLWLVLLVPFTLLVTSSIGWFLAVKAMYPINQMIAHARHIGEGQLDQRLVVPQTGDELEWLAVTFNQMLSRLERAFKRLRQFSAAASHELRTPLTVMKGELEVALRKPRDLEEYQRVLQTHLQTIDEMAYTVEVLLMLGRNEAAQGAIERRPVELGQLAREVNKPWYKLAETKSVTLELITEEPVWVRGERHLFERLLTNLLDNALKHTPPYGHITIQVEPRDQEACVTVHDTGPGIAPGELPYLFDRFFKPRLETNGTPSTGIGLGLCRWIAEAHHGHIDVLSPPEGGAMFIIRLPLIPSSPPLSARAS